MAEIEPAVKVGTLRRDEDDLDISFPPAAHYRKATSQERCSNCIHYLKGVCQFWNVKADPDMTCDDWAVEPSEGYVTMAEIYHCDGGLCLDDHGDGLIWKEALRTGTWAMTPGPGQKPTPRPLIVKYDSQDPKHISLKKLVEHFEEGAVDHVTIPLSHADRVDENTGYVRRLKIVPDQNGKDYRLMAGYQFTEPDIQRKVTNGSIANNSVGILFDYVRKRDGKIFPQVLAHIALTNRPWIDGLAPFGIAASEADNYVVLSAVPYVAPAIARIRHTPARARTREAQVARLLGEDSPLGTPGNKKNWVDKAGGLPRYIRRIARDLMEERGMDMSRAIATAVSRVKLWATTSKNPKVRAKAAAAVAEWEKLKGKSRAKTAAHGKVSVGKVTLADAQTQRRLMLSSELLLARAPGWWKTELHPRWPVGGPKGGKFMTKAEIGQAISQGPRKTKGQKDVEYTHRMKKLTSRVQGTLVGQRRAARGTAKGEARTGAKPKEKSGYLKDDPGGGVTQTGKTSQKAILDFVNRALSQPSTAEKYSVVDPKTGERTYSDSRKVIHEKIIDVMLRERKADEEGHFVDLDESGEYLTGVDQPQVLFSGGGYAAGKGSVINGVMRKNGELPGQGEQGQVDNFLLLDPDDIKGMLPEFQDNLEIDPEANLMVYEEAWDIAQEVQRRAQEQKLNMVVDGISNTSPEEFLGRVKSFTDKGYVSPRVVYVDIPTEEALTRAGKRAAKAKEPKDRRHIPEVIMRAVHRDVAATIQGVLKRAPDYGLHVQVWNNNQGWDETAKGGKGAPVPPKLIAEVKQHEPGATGGRPQMNVPKGAEAEFQALLMKAHETIKGISDPGVTAPTGSKPKKLKATSPPGPTPKLAFAPKGRKPAWTRPKPGAPKALKMGLAEARTQRRMELSVLGTVEKSVRRYRRGGHWVKEHRQHFRHAPEELHSMVQGERLPTPTSQVRHTLRADRVIPSHIKNPFEPTETRGLYWTDGVKDGLTGLSPNPPLSRPFNGAYMDGHKAGMTHRNGIARSGIPGGERGAAQVAQMEQAEMDRTLHRGEYARSGPKPDVSTLLPYTAIDLSKVPTLDRPPQVGDLVGLHSRGRVRAARVIKVGRTNATVAYTTEGALSDYDRLNAYHGARDVEATIAEEREREIRNAAYDFVKDEVEVLRNAFWDAHRGTYVPGDPAETRLREQRRKVADRENDLQTDALITAAIPRLTPEQIAEIDRMLAIKRAEYEKQKEKARAGLKFPVVTNKTSKLTDITVIDPKFHGRLMLWDVKAGKFHGRGNQANLSWDAFNLLRKQRRGSTPKETTPSPTTVLSGLHTRRKSMIDEALAHARKQAPAVSAKDFANRPKAGLERVLGVGKHLGLDEPPGPEHHDEAHRILREAIEWHKPHEAPSHGGMMKRIDDAVGSAKQSGRHPDQHVINSLHVQAQALKDHLAANAQADVRTRYGVPKEKRQRRVRREVITQHA